MLAIPLVSLLLGLAPLARAGMYGQPVVNLDAKTFKTVMATEHAAMVAFVAPWCGHCKSLGPEFTAAAQSLTPLIPFYAVDCDASSNKGLCAEYGVQGFPTIKAFPRAGKGAARDYNGERKRGALVDYAKGLVPDRVKKLRVDDGADAALSKFLNDKPDLPHALLIHPSTPSIPFLWKVLGHRLSSKLHLGYIRDSTSHAVLNALGLYDSADTTRDATRAVIWHPRASRTEVVEYDGALKFNALLEWLQSHIDGTTTPPSSDQKQKPLKADKKAKSEEAERRDKERRVKAAKANGGSKVEEAPDAVPAEGVTADIPPLLFETSGKDAADPAPQADVEEEAGEEAVQTGKTHEEL